MDKKTIERNAKTIWMVLSYGGYMTYRELKTRVRLPDRELNMALGWLAHEGKIEFDESCRDEFITLGINVYI